MTAATPLLEARAVSKAFARKPALVDVSVTLHRSELVGIVGPDGAGKTSLLRALVGLTRIDGGEALVDGIAWTTAPDEARERLGYMPQNYSLYADLSVDENLVFFGDLFGIARKTFEERRARLLDITRLGPARDRPAGALSGGMYKKLAVACALLHQPPALVLDEPTNGVDPVSRRELWALLYEFVAEGMGVLVSTPYMDEAARCGRVVLMHRGSVLAHGSPTSLAAALEHPVVRVNGGDRRRVLSFLEGHPGVLAVTPAGERVRAVLLSDSYEDVVRAIASYDAVTERVAPDFEDLYLALMAASGRALS